jgi:hypothetical protein
MVGRMATYTYNGDDVQDLARRAEEGILPILKASPGFAAYTVSTGDGEILSLSAWETRADAEAGSAAVAAWVSENMSGELDLVGIRYAEVLFSTTLGISTKAAAIA